MSEQEANTETRTGRRPQVWAFRKHDRNHHADSMITGEGLDTEADFGKKNKSQERVPADGY